MDLSTLTADDKKRLKLLFRQRRAFIDDRDIEELEADFPDIDDILITSWDYTASRNVYDLTVKTRMFVGIRN